jgi:hypothetical protein
MEHPFCIGFHGNRAAREWQKGRWGNDIYDMAVGLMLMRKFDDLLAIWIDMHALHAYQSRLPGKFGLQGVVFGDPCMHANQLVRRLLATK